MIKEKISISPTQINARCYISLGQFSKREFIFGAREKISGSVEKKRWGRYPNCHNLLFFGPTEIYERFSWEKSYKGEITEGEYKALTQC